MDGTGHVQHRRRGRDVGLRGPLVEREREVASIKSRLTQARDGHGNVTFIEAPAGRGKSRLLSIAGNLAREAGMQVLGAQATELERDFPFGLASQLFEPRWRTADVEERQQMLRGPARHARDLLAGELPATGAGAGERGYEVINALFWLCTNLVFPDDDSVPRPLAMLIDDVQWGDPQSMQFLAYVVRRLDELPVAIVIAARSEDEPSDRKAVAALRRAAREAVLEIDPLTPAGVAALVHEVFPDAAPDFSRACARLTRGNAFLLTELLALVRNGGQAPDAATAARMGQRPPGAVLEEVTARLDELPEAVRRVAMAVAVLDGAGTLEIVVSLTDLRFEDVLDAGDRLAAMHVFCPGLPFSFVHPLVEAAVKGSIPALDSSRLHRRAATLLLEREAPAEQVAAHLLACAPQPDGRTTQALRDAATRALAGGAAESAARMLDRALSESPTEEIRTQVLTELAEAELRAGLPHAVERLHSVLESVRDPTSRLRLALAHGDALYARSDYRKAADAFALALMTEQPSDDRGLTDRLRGSYLTAAFFVPDLRGESRSQARELLAGAAKPLSLAALDALAHLTAHGGLLGEGRDAVHDVARRAWDGGRLLEANGLDGPSWPLLIGALIYVGELEWAIEICDAAVGSAREQDRPDVYAAARYCRAWAVYEQGQILPAAADAQAGLDAPPEGWRSYLRAGYGALACCHIHTGELDRAETALSALETPAVHGSIHLPSLYESRAKLRLAQRRPREALRDAMRAGEQLETVLGHPSPGAVAWRSTAALAHLALGDADRAQELADQELEQARRIGLPRLISRNLRVLGLAVRGKDGLDLLAEAVTLGSQTPARLEYMYALVEYGSALRRANQRVAAREPLRQALELAQRGGATALADVARRELVVAGARPRRDMLTGIESLTPSEHRVAEAAARGMTTRQIAEALFVTPKTVEFHLRHIYQKLDVSSRGELTDALQPA